MSAVIRERESRLLDLHYYEIGDAASLPLGMAGAPLPAQGDSESLEDSGPLALEQPDQTEVDQEQDGDDTTWGLNSVWRWRLMTVRNSLTRRDMSDLIVGEIGGCLQRIAGVMAANHAVTAGQSSV